MLSSACTDVFSNRDTAFAVQEILTRQNSQAQEHFRLQQALS